MISLLDVDGVQIASLHPAYLLDSLILLQASFSTRIAIIKEI